ncbi:MAG: hypothetical protein LBB47_07150 [Spirochaetaceae bacterium]|nr:hypothetical protein [Spirochaetaceae bacterium]
MRFIYGKQKYVSSFLIACLVITSFAGCENTEEGVLDIDPPVVTAGNISLIYNRNQIAIYYDKTAGKVHYGAVPGNKLVEVIFTYRDEETPPEKTTIDEKYKGNGNVKLEVSGVDDSGNSVYYSPVDMGWVDASGKRQETVKSITFVSAEKSWTYEGDISVEIVPADLRDFIVWDPSIEKSFAYDGFNNYILTLNGELNDGYVIDWTKYTYSDKYLAGSSEKQKELEASWAASHPGTADPVTPNTLLNAAEIYGFYGEKFNVTDYTKLTIHIKRLNAVDKTGLIASILEAATAKSGVLVDEDGTKVPDTMLWVTQSELDTFSKAIEGAETVKNNVSAVQTEIDTAKSVLDAAIKVFQNAKKQGKKQLAPDERLVDRTTLFNKIIDAYSAKIKISVSDLTEDQVDEGLKFVSTAEYNTFGEAIKAAEKIYQSTDEDIISQFGTIKDAQESVDKAAETLSTAILVFEKAIKTGKKNIYKENTDKLVPGSYTVEDVVFPPQNFDYKLFGQEYEPVIITDNVTFAPKVSGAEQKDEHGNTLIVTARGINSEDGKYDWTVPADGYYQITLWGAQGGNVVTKSKNSPNGVYVSYGGRGAKTQGIIWLKENQKLTFYLGGQGRGSYLNHGTGYIAAGFNGGGTGGIGIVNVYPDGAGGGGATDVRINGRRIMVAAGGGGGSQQAYEPWYAIPGGAGGDYESDSTLGIIIGNKARSVSGVKPLNSSPALRVDGTGQNAASKTGKSTIFEGNGGGGGGYYGGYANQNQTTEVGSGSGGTSYISGYEFTGANADKYSEKYPAEYFSFNKNTAKMWKGSAPALGENEGKGNGRFEVRSVTSAGS